MKGIRILGQFVEVRYEPIQADNAGETAFLSNGQCRISIDSCLTPERLETCLLHEMMHVISYRLHLNLDEAQVKGLETGLYPAGVRPPKLEEE